MYSFVLLRKQDINTNVSSLLCSEQTDGTAAQGDLVQQEEVHTAQHAAQQAQLQALKSQNQEVCLSQRVRQHPWAGRGSGIPTYKHHKQTNANVLCVLVFCEHGVLI